MVRPDFIRSYIRKSLLSFFTPIRTLTLYSMIAPFHAFEILSITKYYGK